MTKQEALAAIKQLRDRINDVAEQSATSEMWENAVVEALDRAADLLEFPKQ